MKRAKRDDGKADAILTADLHLTLNTPMSRVDDYMKAQEYKLGFLKNLSEVNNHCPILCAGDVFDHWKASPWLCSWAFQHLPQNIITIPGNHDLPMHSLEQYEKSALSLLEVVGLVIVLKGDSICIGELEIFGAPFGRMREFDPDFGGMKKTGRRILLLHELVVSDKKASWAMEGTHYTTDILGWAKDFDLIVSGDNHQSFTAEKAGDIISGKGRNILVNPGSMMRITAAQTDFQPKCYLYYAKSNTVEAVELPIQENVHNRKHLDDKKEREERTAAYIQQIGNNALGEELSFRKNLETFLKQNKTPRKVCEIIWKCLKDEQG